MLKIEQIFAFVSCDTAGEGIIAFKTPEGWMPMVGADMKRVESLLPIALKMNVKFRILKFYSREDITQQIMNDVEK